MTEAAFDPAILDQSDDIELVFDEEPVAPPVPEKKGRAPRKGVAAKAEAEAPAAEQFPRSTAPERDAADEPADPPAPVPQPGDASAGSLLQPVAAGRAQRLMIGAALGCAMLTSLMSLGGLIAVNRSLTAIAADRATIAEERTALAGVPKLVATLARTAAQRPAPVIAAPVASVGVATATPLTSDDLHHSLDALRLAIDARQPAGMTAIAATLQSGLSEIGTRLDRIEAAQQRPAAPHQTRTPR